MESKNLNKYQILQLIECPPIDPEVIVFRFPSLNFKIKSGTKLVVKKNQVAVLTSDGKIGDVFTEGEHKLTVKNMPVLSKQNDWNPNYKGLFEMQIYYISLLQFINIKWSTANPVIMRDDNFGMIRIRAFGNFSFQVSDASVFMKEIFGSINKFNPDNVSLYLKSLVVTGFSENLAETRISALNLASYYDELSLKSFDKIKENFEAKGLSLIAIMVENISLPEEIEKIITRGDAIEVFGKVSTSQARMQLTQSSKNQVIKSTSFNDSNNLQNKTLPLNINTVTCNHCSALIAIGLKFCPQCGMPNKDSVKICPKCENVITFKAKFCPDCGNKLYDPAKVILCKGCGKIVDERDNYCPDCGQIL